MNEWTPTSWHKFPIAQQPEYDRPDELTQVTASISRFPPLVFSGEVETLKSHLRRAARGECFILQGGDCAERIVDCRPEIIARKLKILLQMSLVLEVTREMPTILIGRCAGQYAKPRTSPIEIRNGTELPVFRGDNVNDFAFEAAARRANPQRLLQGHYASALTLNFLRAMLDGGLGDWHHSEHDWDVDLGASEIVKSKYLDVLSRARSVMAARSGGITFPFYTSHEGLLLFYEEAMTRRVPHRSSYYDLSAHFLWIGEKTRQLDGAHVEFFRGIGNPVGLKVGPHADSEEIVATVEKLNPHNEPGKIVLMTRFGESVAEDKLKALISAVTQRQLNVVWFVDPMHGNTHVTDSGIKTRDFGKVCSEVQKSISVHAEMGTVLAGVHFEMSGENITECIGGSEGLSEKDLSRQYESYCDPRLNYSQSLEMALRLGNQFSEDFQLQNALPVDTVQWRGGVETPSLT